MPNNRKVYIIGHKNPDTDSICSAIAYADIKNRTDKSRVYAARRAGSINAVAYTHLDVYKRQEERSGRLS